MLYFICAVYPEATAFITYYNLKKNSSYRRFQVYEGSQATVIITGTGPLRSAMALTEFLTKLELDSQTNLSSSPQTLFINVGLAGYFSNSKTQPSSTEITDSAFFPKKGDLYLVNKITDELSKRDFYPDMLYRHPFHELSVHTFESVQANKNNTTIDSMPYLVDMEAAALYQAGIRFLKPSQILFFKIVSDFCDSIFPSKNEINEWMTSAAKDITTWLAGLENALSVQQEKTASRSFYSPVEKNNFQPLYDTICKQWDCSETMKNELHQLFDYAILCKFSKEQLENILQQLMVTQNEMPKSQYTRKDGKKFLEQFKRNLLQ